MDLNFNADQHEDMSDFSILPKGWYLVTVTKDEKRTSESSGNSYLALEYTVMDGNFKGRKIFNNLNLFHPKTEVKQMAERELATLCRAINRRTISSSSELHNIPFGVKLRHRKDKQTGEMREQTGGYCGEKEFPAKSGGSPTTATTTTTTDTGQGASPAPWSAN